jgi:hypothetical protein
MSYREENGQVILTMSRDDYERILFRLGAAFGACNWRCMDEELRFLNRLNEGNPNFTPYVTSTQAGGPGPGSPSPSATET